MIHLLATVEVERKSEAKPGENCTKLILLGGCYSCQKRYNLYITNKGWSVAVEDLTLHVVQSNALLEPSP